MLLLHFCTLRAVYGSDLDTRKCRHYFRFRFNAGVFPEHHPGLGWVPRRTVGDYRCVISLLDQMPFQSPNEQCESAEGISHINANWKWNRLYVLLFVRLSLFWQPRVHLYCYATLALVIHINRFFLLTYFSNTISNRFLPCRIDKGHIDF